MEPRKAPPRGSYYVICDICGVKIRANAAILITDKFHTHYNLLVCKKDFTTRNPQTTLKAIKDDVSTNPKKTRPELPERNVNNIATALPSVPYNLIVTVSPLEDKLILRWYPPLNPNGIITGYVITRADPQSSTQFVIEADTESACTQYIDNDSDINLAYTYAVAAINGFGTSAYSELAYYPTQQEDLIYSYLTVSQTGFVLTTGEGEFFLSSDLV